MRHVLFPALLLLLGCPTDDKPETEETGEGEGEGEGEGDSDGDGYSADDCDDADPGVFPGAIETCDGRDEDCDGVEDNDPADGEIWYVDGDSDGWGEGDGVLACEEPTGAVPQGGDCDDASPFVYPGADERCDGVDNDCDERADEDLETSTWYVDDDRDGYGSTGGAISACEAPDGYAENSADCDDGSSEIYPGAEERCDDLDNDCDGEADEDASGTVYYYADEDRDGYGDPLDASLRCAASEAWVADDSDCDDADADINPGADEVACDGVDDDCDGSETGARFVSASGTSTDVSALISAGTASTPYAYTMSSDGTLYVCPGTWYVNISVRTDDLSITGLWGAEDTVLSGGGEKTILTLYRSGGALALSGLTLADGYGENGGAIQGQDDSLVVSIDDCIFSGNISTDEGGAIYLDDGDLSVSNSTFSENMTEGNGGAIATRDTYINVESSTFSDNSADKYGGAVYIGTSAYTSLTYGTVYDSVLSGNSASQGGAIWVYYSGLEIENSKIYENSAGYGGGVYTNYNYSSYTDTSIYDNTATYGGGLYGYWGSMSMDCSDSGGVWGNGSGSYGGGVYITYTGSVTSKNCDFGADAEDNSSYDVVLGYARVYTSAYEDEADFTCSGELGACY